MKISLIIPVYNEEENLASLYSEIKAVLDNNGYDYEIIFIDDGSTDNSCGILKNLKLKDQFLRIISFKKNYGQSAALKAGFEKAEGDIFLTMDSDLQNDPADIPKLLDFIGRGYDVVSGWRRNRIDSLNKKICSKIANRVRDWIIKDGIKDTGCMLKAYRRSAVKNIEIFKGFHRFLPSLMKIRGFKIIEIEVNHRMRKFGQSNYGIINRVFKSFLDTFIVLWMKNNYISPDIKEEL
ncbi:MAG: glycosyltransferase family 2 protein [Candidatus Omnitrophica bacterium]|nr:glycosyltransferase family 2 protein [Candidatus Omnitrophota bacterium]